jgi:hypothetical protein
MYSRQIDPNLTAEQLRAVIDYNPETGVFRWRWRDDVPAHINRRDAGKVAGWTSRKSTGHMKITLNGGSYFLARLAWLHMTGAWPEFEVDHIDDDPTNNVWTNLRDATHSQNMRNMRNRRTTLHNVPRLKGARFHKGTGRWQASIRHNGESLYLGLFPTQALAHAAYCEASVRLHGEFSRTA